jgi:hypothetical protein
LALTGVQSARRIRRPNGNPELQGFAISAQFLPWAAAVRERSAEEGIDKKGETHIACLRRCQDAKGILTRSASR